MCAVLSVRPFFAKLLSRIPEMGPEKHWELYSKTLKPFQRYSSASRRFVFWVAEFKRTRNFAIRKIDQRILPQNKLLLAGDLPWSLFHDRHRDLRSDDGSTVILKLKREIGCPNSNWNTKNFAGETVELKAGR